MNIRKRWLLKHYGPGDHRSGSGQDVHGGEGESIRGKKLPRGGKAPSRGTGFTGSTPNVFSMSKPFREPKATKTSASVERGMRMLSPKHRRRHPRSQVQSLRRIAQLALTRNKSGRAKDALNAAIDLNVKHDLGYSVRSLER